MKNQQTEPGAIGFLAGAYFFLACLVLLACNACAAPQLPRDARPAERRDAYSVKIEACGGVGSGVVIGDRKILTANHVAEDCPEMIVEFADGRRMNATLDKAWPGRDTARLTVDASTGLGKPSFAKADSNKEVCTTTAYPARGGACGPVGQVFQTPVCQEGRISRWCYDFNFSTYVVGGNSGSAIYDSDGNLIGLVTGGVSAFGIPYPLGYGTLLAPIAKEIMQW